jgi:hypothetical protein
MTSLLDHFTGTTDEPEEASMPVPPQGLPTVPGTSAIPWWTGVPGLDPDLRNYGDWTYAAECAAIACGVHVLGLDAARVEWARLRMKSPVQRWAKWLTDGGQAQAPKRTLTLRLVCERSAAIGPEYILQVAQDLCAAGTLR